MPKHQPALEPPVAPLVVALRAHAQPRQQRPLHSEHTRRSLTQLESESRAARVLPFALSLMVPALLFLSLAAIPARAVPWFWVLRGLDHRRLTLAFSGSWSSS